MTKKDIYKYYKSGEKPKVGDLVCYDGKFWDNCIGELALVKEVCKVNEATYIIVVWLYERGNEAGTDIWPWNLALVRRDAKKLISWI